MYKCYARLLVVAGSMMEDVKVNIGELFQDLEHRDDIKEKMSECQTKAGNQITLSHSILLSLSHSFTLSLFHSLTLNMLNNFCFHVYAQNSLSHFHTLTLSHSRTLTLSHSFNVSFNHSRHAEQLLFSCLGSKVTVYSRKLQCFFF